MFDWRMRQGDYAEKYGGGNHRLIGEPMTHVHILAFNADQYRDRLVPQFPNVTFTTGVDKSNLGEGLYECDVLIGFGPILFEEPYEKNTNLKFIQALGTGVDGFADRDGLSKDLLLSSMRGMHGPQMAEMTIMMMLAFNRGLPRILDNQKAKKWERWPGPILGGRTLGIWGVGLIAETVAARAKAFDMNVIGISNTPRDILNFDRIYARAEVLDAVADVDYLLLLAPYTPENHYMVNAEVLAAMKPSSILINLARGKVADDQAIIDALTSGGIAGAALDVFDEEPLPRDSALWELPNVILTPHMGGMTTAYADLALPTIEHNLAAFLEGRFDEMKNRV